MEFNWPVFGVRMNKKAPNEFLFTLQTSAGAEMNHAETMDAVMKTVTATIAVAMWITQEQTAQKVRRSSVLSNWLVINLCKRSNSNIYVVNKLLFSDSNLQSRFLLQQWTM